MKRLAIIAAGLALLAAASVSGCGGGRGNITGTTYDTNGQPTSGTWIRAQQSGGNAVLVQSDTEGHYTLAGLPAGTWVVSFFQSNTEAGRETVTVKGGKSVTLDFTAGAKPPPEHPEVIVPPG